MDKGILGIILGIIVLCSICGIVLVSVKISPIEYEEVKLRRLLDYPESYENKYVNVSGYLEYKERVRWTIIMPHIYYTYDSDGNPQTHIGFQIIEKELYIFRLHEEPTKDSPYLTIIRESSGAYFPMFPLPFWYSSAWGVAHSEPNIVYDEVGYAKGKWVNREVREHGKFWCLDTD